MSGRPAPRAAGAPGALPVIAIIGRPNAGKSTLFNRLTKSQRALVDAEPGVTRDRNFGEARIGDRRVLLVDTGGFEAEPAGELESEVLAQSALAVEEADAIIYLVDGRAGVSPADHAVAQRLRNSGKPAWLAVNKLDTANLDDDAADFFALGLEQVVAISAAHGRGIRDLLEEVAAALPVAPDEAATAADAVSVAIVGRPNVGKSSLLNRLVGYERSIVTPIAGTTRDAIDTPIEFAGKGYVLVDTAGIRRRPRVHEHLERASAVRALRALERCEVAVLLIDAGEGMTDQDARIAGYAWEGGRGLVLVVNKSDLLGRGRAPAEDFARELRRQYPFLDDVELLFTSALSGSGVQAVMGAVERAAANHRRQVQTAELNQIIHRAVEMTAPPSPQGKRVTFQYAVQTSARPPVIVLFCSAPERVPVSYTRYLVNQLRAAFAFTGTPLRLRYRARARRNERPPPSGGARKPQPKSRRRGPRRG